MFSRILIANRGEIAQRIIRACKEMGVETVCVYSEEDRGALYLGQADHTVCIGPASPSQSYLRGDRIISAAEIYDVDAIHPGYGFLAENAEFAENCERSGLAFIGPTAAQIRRLGHKAEARGTMVGAGGRVLPRSDGPADAEGGAAEAALPAALSGSHSKASGLAGGYLL